MKVVQYDARRGKWSVVVDGTQKRTRVDCRRISINHEQSVVVELSSTKICNRVVLLLPLLMPRISLLPFWFFVFCEMCWHGTAATAATVEH